MTPPAPAGLGGRLELAERESAELRERIESKKRQNEELARRLEELSGRRPARSRRRVLLRVIAVIALVGAGAGLYLGLYLGSAGTPAVPPIRVVKDSLAPSLLVTSTPESAQVRVEGERVGLTPVLVPLAPVARRYQILLEAPGHRRLEGEVSVTATAGAHFHGRLVEKAAE